mmetsp:Transcript_139683/g.243182  ORF Transcript_139683/g.243182 Transcript_139683/m.243182 type:complete len:102 (-) Transcript_139683:984-1289(-)
MNVGIMNKSLLKPRIRSRQCLNTLPDACEGRKLNTLSHIFKQEHVRSECANHGIRRYHCMRCLGNQPSYINKKDVHCMMRLTMKDKYHNPEEGGDNKKNHH